MSAYRLDPLTSRLELWTYKEGLLSGVAHDLCFRAADLELSVNLHEDDGVEVVEVVFGLPVDGLQLSGQVNRKGHVTPMKPKDASDIRKNLSGPRVLDTDHHPVIRYQGRGTPDAGAVTLEGELTLRGIPKPLPVKSSWRREDSRVRVEGEVRFAQSWFGITPFTALLGSLRVEDEVRVSWSLTLEESAS